MVANSTTISHPVPPPAQWSAARSGFQVLLTTKDIRRMVQAGIVPEDASTELLHGVLVYVDRAATGTDLSELVPTQSLFSGSTLMEGSEIVEGPNHNFVLSVLADLGQSINSVSRRLRTQSTLLCSDDHAPIPDAVVLRGSLNDYRGRLPAASDVICVIEVADSSYERDSGEKLFGYASAAIQQYVIINLRNRTAEVYTSPDAVTGTYPPPAVIAADQTLSLRVGNDEFFSVAMGDLLR